MPRHPKLASIAAVASLLAAAWRANGAGCVGHCADLDPSRASACGHEQLLLQLGPAGLSKAALLGEATEAECHTTVEGEECYSHVIWAMETGIRSNPEWYPGLIADSSFEDFQARLHREDHTACPVPCSGAIPTLGSSTTSEPVQASTTPALPPVEQEPEAECHTAVEGEECHSHVVWAMKIGIEYHPDWYVELTAESSFEDFQAILHKEDHTDCPVPCSGTTTTLGSSTTSEPVQASTTPASAPVEPGKRHATVGTSRIPIGGEIRFYVIGTSNVAWQTWPDQLHVLLRDLGYIIPQQNYQLANLIQPMSRAPVCDNAEEYKDLETPRIGKVGWSSWGFAYDSKDDCEAASYEGAIGEHGFREIAGHQVSCVNSWACNPAGQRNDTLVSPTAVAQDARDAHVVLLSNWINDSRQRWSQYRCFQGEEIELVDTTDITVENLRRLIQAIHRESPTTVVLIMALYPDAAGLHVRERTLTHVAAINEQVRTRVNEPNTYFVDYTFPTGQEVFSSSNPGHLNCRGDMVMATKALEVMFDKGVLAKGLALPTGDEAAVCLADTACAAITDKACCQMAASCYVGMSGLCEAFGPGAQ